MMYLPSPDAGPNSLKVSESFLERVLAWLRRGSGPRAQTVQCMGQKNARANQAQKRCNSLNHRMSFFAMAGQNDKTCRTVKKIRRPHRKAEPGGDLEQQSVRERALEKRRFSAAARQIDGPPRQPLIHHLTALPISAVFGMRYLHILVRRWAASGRVAVRCLEAGMLAAEMVIGANGDSTARSDCSDGAQRCRRGSVPRRCELCLIRQVRQPCRSQIRRFQ
jgi:hypothetical protein